MLPDSAPDHAAHARMPWRSLALLLVLCGAAFLEGVDIAMFNIALPAIRTEFDLSTTQLQWIVSGYIVGYGGFMILGGRCADRFGRRRVFLAALLVFALFSGLGGFSSESWLLIAARVVTGIAAAFMMPAGLSIIATSFAEGKPRRRALLIYAGIASSGFSVGLVAGGLLTILGWRWVFLAPFILSSMILGAAIWLVPRQASTAGEDSPSIDAIGAVQITLSLVLLVASIEQATHSQVLALVLFASSLALATLFLVREGRVRVPLIPRGFLNARLARVYLGAGLLSAAFMGQVR